MARKPKYMKPGDVVEMARTYFPSFLRSRDQALRMDRWMNGKQYLLSDQSDDLRIDADDPAFGLPFLPAAADANDEYDNLRGLSPNNFGGLIVTTLAQTAYVEGISRPGIKGKLPSWESWQRNRWDSLQTSVHRCAIGMAEAYGVVVPGFDPLTGAKMSRMLAKSPKAMAGFYDNDDSEWCRIAIEAYERYEQTDYSLVPMKVGWTVTIYDSYVNHRLICSGNGLLADDWTYLDYTEHGIPVPPVARLANRVDLDGHTTGEIEPVLPLLRRIDQDVFDRLIVQRFGAWQIRYIAGMAKPKTATDAAAERIRLRVEDLLISTDKDTKFGTLEASPLAPMIEATDADLRLLSAISQTPPHHLLGLSSNLQAEALAAAESGLHRKGFDFRINAGEFHEQMARLDAMARGDMATANAYDLQVRWKDTTPSTELAVAADALGKLATMLHVPIEMLWEKIPGWTDTDVERAKGLVEDGSMEDLFKKILEAEGDNEPPPAETEDPPEDA